MYSSVDNAKLARPAAGCKFSAAFCMKWRDYSTKCFRTAVFAVRRNGPDPAPRPRAFIPRFLARARVKDFFASILHFIITR